MKAVIIATLLVLAVATRPTPPEFCQDGALDHFCSVLPGQGLPLPPPIPDSEMVDVYVMQAPVWEFVPGLGKFTAEAKLIHTAIGLVNQVSNATYTFEFEGVFESPNATFPWIVENNEFPGNEEIVWCNAGAICWGEGIDWKYYTETLVKVGSINGTIFNQLIAWLPAENNTDSIWYETFAVYKDWSSPIPENNHMYLPSYTCDDFAWKTLGIMRYWGMEFDDSLVLKRDFLNFYVGDNEPMLVNVSDSSNYEKVSSFYTNFQLNRIGATCAAITDKTKKDECEFDAALVLFSFLESNKYVYIGEEYYWVNQVPIGFDWHFAPMNVTAQPPSAASLAAVADKYKYLFE